MLPILISSTNGSVELAQETLNVNQSRDGDRIGPLPIYALSPARLSLVIRLKMSSRGLHVSEVTMYFIEFVMRRLEILIGLLPPARQSMRPL